MDRRETEWRYLERQVWDSTELGWRTALAERSRNMRQCWNWTSQCHSPQPGIRTIVDVLLERLFLKGFSIARAIHCTVWVQAAALDHVGCYRLDRGALRLYLTTFPRWSNVSEQSRPHAIVFLLPLSQLTIFVHFDRVRVFNQETKHKLKNI